MRQSRQIGHVVLNVRSLERSVPFYRDALGLHEVARMDAAGRAVVGAEMVFFAFADNHHDLALREVPDAPPLQADAIGLAHVAIRIGDSKDELRACRDHLAALGIPLAQTRDHQVSLSLYVRDPDGLLIELYVDTDPALWRNNRAAVATTGPLEGL